MKKKRLQFSLDNVNFIISRLYISYELDEIVQRIIDEDIIEFEDQCGDLTILFPKFYKRTVISILEVEEEP